MVTIPTPSTGFPGPGSTNARTLRSSALFGEQLADLDLAFGMVRQVVRHLDPGALSGDQAMKMAEVLSGFEPVVASGVALLTPRVTSTGNYTKGGFTSAQDWLGAAAGTSAASAKSRLAAAEGAAKVPGLRKALRQGTLSSPQLGLLTQAEVAAPGAAETLLNMVAEKASHQELFDEASRLKAAARSKEQEHQRRARVHARRHFYVHQDPDGGMRGEFSCDEAAWARVGPALEAETRRRWKAAGAEGPDSLDALRLDVFLDFLSQSGTHSEERGVRDFRPEVLILVDAEALRRGTTTTGEVCEIDGIGPVAVEAVIELLGQGAAQILVKEGTDIRTVTNSSRRLAQKTLMALIARDRTCVIKGCGKHLGLENDHCFVDYGADGPTTYDNLARLCPRHHALKTDGGWVLRRYGPDQWQLDAPPDPPSAGALRRARRLAVAKAKAGVTSSKAKRNQPRQT